MAHYRLAVSVAGAGLVTDAAGLSCAADCAGSYEANDSVTLRAVPGAAQRFTGWTGDCAGTAPCTLRVTRDLTVGARFAPATATLVVQVSGPGMVVSTPAGIACPGACRATFPAGTQVMLSASASAGSNFSGWTGACTGAATCQLSLSQDAAAAAAFGAPPPPPSLQKLTVAVQGQGTVTSAPAGISCPGICAASFAAGTNVTLSASPAPGSTFGAWAGGCTGAAGCAIALSADASVAATFTVLPPPPPPPPPPASFALTVAVRGAGTVTSIPPGISCPGTCSSSFPSGVQISLAAVPAAGSVFSGWSGSCTGLAGCALTLAGDNAVVATFANVAPAPTRVLTTTVQGQGTVTSNPPGISCSAGGAGTCTATFPTDTAVALKAAPGAGSAFAGWSGACSAAYDCRVALASDSSVGVQFAPSAASSPADWTFYGTAQGVPSQVLGVSADAGGNLWVAGGEEGLFVLRPGAASFQRFTMAEGLRPYGYMPDGSAPPGTPYLKVLSVAGGPPDTVYVGYAGKPPGPGQLDCESNWDGPNPDPSIYKSGDADKVTLVGNGISVVHYDIFSGPGVISAEARGREKLCNVLRVVYDPGHDAVWFGANHGFAIGRARFQGAPLCNGQFACAGVWEHVHPAINAWSSSARTSLVLLTGDYNGVAIDPVTQDIWFGGQNRTTKFHYETQHPSYWGESYWRAETLTEGAQYYANRIDVWPDKVGEPIDYPIPSDRVDDLVSGIGGMQDGTAWVGSFYLGLARLDANGVVLGYVKDQLPAPHLGGVAADSFTPPGQAQSVWAGLRWGGGLVRIAGGTVTQVGASVLGATIANSPVRDIQMQGSGAGRRVLVAFENGVVGVYGGQ